ncbi:MAG: hypothetical protein JXN65_01420 [Clostridia bacterium]|nr:hypothetical protein [Clostridia bacterium]
MKKSKKLLLLLVALTLVFTFVGCRSKEAAEAIEPKTETMLPLDSAIVDIMADRLTALETSDYDLYMHSIGRNNQFLYNEQERWFMNMIDPRIQDIAFEVLSVEMIDDSTGVVNIHQTHHMGETFDFEYPLLFKYEDGRWMDYGYNFEIYKTDRFMVKYMKGEERVEEFAQMLEDAFDNLESVYVERPWDNYEMKLFTDQEMLRQRTIPANLWLFTGWSEPDESLKLYTGHPKSDYDGYPGVVQHELVHHITINICNNNLPLWLLEGIAMYDGSAYYGFETNKMLSLITNENVANTIQYMETNDLTKDLTKQEIYNFYNTGYMYVRFIDQVYGRDKLMDIFYEAGKKPFHDSTLNETFESDNQQTASEVIMTVLGLTKEELSTEYLAWLDTLDFDALGDLHK